MRRVLLCVCAAGAFCLAGCGGDPGALGERELEKFTVTDFSLTTTTGDTVTLGDHLGRNIVLIAFLGTTMEDADRALSGVKRYHEAWGQPLRIIVIYDAASADAIEDHVKKHGLKCTVAVDAGDSVASSYRVKRRPTFVVISRDGRVIYHGHTVEIAGMMIDEAMTQ